MDRTDIIKVDDSQVINKLEQLELDVVNRYGYSKISGGFASADIFNYDEKYFDIELKSGIQSDCQNEVSIEQLKMDRSTWEIIRW